MPDLEFRILVAKLRAAQVAYFAFKSGDMLSLSKSLERQVDKAIMEFTNRQESLFDRSEGS